MQKSRCIVYELKTDSVLCRPPKRRKARILEDIKYQDLHSLRDRFEGKEKRLNEHCIMQASDVNEPVFRVHEACEDDLLKTNPNRPRRSSKMDVSSPTWKDLSIEDAESRVIVKGESLCVFGSPGTGKTTLLQGITERLRSLGKTVDII